MDLPSSSFTVESPSNFYAREIKEQLISVFSQVEKINELHSAKIFIDSGCDDKKFKKDYVVIVLDSSSLSEAVNLILEEASFSIQNTNGFIFKWTALLKDKEGNFHSATGLKKFSKEDFSASEKICKGIRPNCIEAYFNKVLERIGRNASPQLNDQLDFI